MAEKLLIIAGPSGVGKTDLSIKLAKKFNGEIISCDSMQIYKHFDIGTAKIKEDEKQGIKHYMIDICDADSEYSVGQYKQMSTKIIGEINENGKLPIMVGGTGLYIDAVLYDYDFGNTNKDTKVRDYYTNLALKYGNQFLVMELEKKKIDFPKNDYNNTRRLVRLFEIGENKKTKTNQSKYDFLYICLYMSREELYNKLDSRVDKMMCEGLLDEVKNLLSSGVNFNCQAMQAIGYKEFVAYFNGESTLEMVVDTIKKNTRHYAKRQLTWFRNNSDVLMYDVSNGFDELIRIIEKWRKNG